MEKERKMKEKPKSQRIQSHSIIYLSVKTSITSLCLQSTKPSIVEAKTTQTMNEICLRR